MIRVLLDNDIDGFQSHLVSALESTGWSEYQLVELLTLSQVGLERATNDRVIWRFCQLNGLVLLTANRNQDDADSLEQTMSEENTPASLPVLTVTDQRRLHNAAYREACIESLLTIIIDLNNHLGTGRLYIP